ncbi:hypothetical protein GHK30_11475 [Sinorhizobium medicae]|nr:hypothetical protein [Sinorhizobium medicae]
METFRPPPHGLWAAAGPGRHENSFVIWSNASRWVHCARNNRRSPMKSILVLAAAFALSATAAFADCIGHSNTTASTDAVDKEFTTASVKNTEQSTSSKLLLQQQKEQRSTEEAAE